MKTLIFNCSNEWLIIFSAVDFTERLASALEGHGFETQPATGQKATCHG